MIEKLTATQKSSLIEGTDKTLVEQVLERARASGGRLAISQGCSEITYRELASRAVQLAQFFEPYLKAQRGPIAVATSDTTEMICAALASWMLGCPYLPLDPTGPAHRMEHMLRESGSLILVSGSTETRSFPSGPWELIQWRSVTRSSFGSEQVVPQVKATPEDAAYIIYTSGSTGLPKGVVVTHNNLIHFVDWYRTFASITADDRATQFASLTFDASVFEIWSHLATGASIWPVGRGVALAEQELQKFILQHSITHCFAPTAIAEDLLDLTWQRQTSLRFLLTGADTLRRFPPKDLPFQLVNNYGPTECTVLSTSGVIQPNDDIFQVPTIGRAIPGTQIHLLEGQLNPVAPGIIGEIFIGGRGVARGYVGQAELSQARFLANPFAEGERMYRTGDRGRLRDDGEIEFCGRLDSQLKVRGYRIEPDEIVQKLRTHKSVHACAVKAVGTGSNAQVAVYLEIEHPVTADELRQHLEEHLPAYMIPDYFVRVDRLPLSDRGKIDMASLPAPSEANLLPHGASDGEAALSEVETELAEIVCQLLKRSSVNLTDNFFRLGGHSLLAAQVIARVRQSFGVDLPLRTVFEASSVRTLAAHIEQKILASLPVISAETAIGNAQHQEG